LGPLLSAICATTGEPRSVVIMNNAVQHHSDMVVRLIEEAGAVCLYTAPYTPELNPIESMFGQYKRFLRRHKTMDWIHANFLGLCCVTPAHAKSYFRKCEVQVPGCEHYGEEGDEEALVPMLASRNSMSALGAVLYQDRTSSDGS
jgi:hypothetical protein